MKKEKKEADNKVKAGTAWSHSYLNQKPWHPLSYPNQRRKWIAEQTHSQREDRKAEVAREFAQEQEFFRQTSQMSKKEKERMEALQAVSFMYIRPPGYNAEAARAAEIADERKRLGLTTGTVASTTNANTLAITHDADAGTSVQEKRKPRAKDVFGRTLPTEEEFPALKNAPRHDTGGPVRVKPFAIEIRNVKCARCGAFGHQSGDRECPLKDVLMPNEEARLRREDPLNVILAQTASEEPLKWELKQQPGLSPARGGFKPNDPNQQIIPDEDIYDEYGGFLPGGGDEGPLSIPNLLASLSKEQRDELTDVKAVKHKQKKHKKDKRKHRYSDRRKAESSADKPDKYRPRNNGSSTSSDDDRRSSRSKRKRKPDSSDDDQAAYNLRADRGLHSQKSGRSDEDRKAYGRKDYKRSDSIEAEQTTSHIRKDKRRSVINKDEHRGKDDRKSYTRDSEPRSPIGRTRRGLDTYNDDQRSMDEGKSDSSDHDQRDHRGKRKLAVHEYNQRKHRPSGRRKYDSSGEGNGSYRPRRKRESMVDDHCEGTSIRNGRCDGREEDQNKLIPEDRSRDSRADEHNRHRHRRESKGQDQGKDPQGMTSS